jgi:SAM-dependent methyltransferase
MTALRGFTPPNPAVRLNLGCGRSSLPGWVNLDCVDLPGVDVVADLNDCRKTPLPFPDNSVDEFYLSHVIEHIADTLALMQELHRIGKPGAKLVARTPYGSSDDAWEDPTHVRPYFIQSWGYFSQPYFWRADYQFRGDWQPETLDLLTDKDGMTAERLFAERNTVREMVATLRCVKPIRAPKRELQVLPTINFVKVPHA